MTRYALPALALLLPSLAQAVFPFPPPANGGIIEKQLEKEYEAEPIAPEREVPLLEVEVPEEQLQIEGDVRVYISSIELKGATVLSEETVQKLLAPYLCRELSMGEIQALCTRIQAHYVKEGYFLARAFPPVQQIDQGVLTIEVLEGKLGEVFVVGNKHYSQEFIKSYLLHFQGKPIQYDAFLRALFLLNENIDLNAGAVFQKGKQFGTADLVLRVEDRLPLHVYLDYNNYGSSLNSLYRSGLRVDYGSCITTGDQLTFVEVIGFPPKDLSFTDLIYTIPLNRRGMALSLSYLYAPFRVGRFRELRLKGYSSVAAVNLQQALQRTRHLSTDISVNFSYDQIKNCALGKTTSFDKLRILQMRFDYDYTDRYKGRNVGDLSLSAGIPNFLGGLSAVDSSCSRKGAGGRFFILNADYQRIQELFWHSFLLVNGSGQVTPNKLPIPQQFYIGGQGTVRGYPLATALGDDGYFLNFELRTPLPAPGMLDKRVPLVDKKWQEFLQLAFFLDNGQVFLNGGGENQKHHISLTGAGVGFRIFGPWNFNFAYDVGFGLSSEKRTSSSIYYFKLAWQLL